MDELDFIDISKRTVKTANRSGVRKADKNTMEKRRKRRRRKRIRRRLFAVALLVFNLLLLAGLICFLISVIKKGSITDVFSTERNQLVRENESEKPEITESFLTENPYSRPGERLKKVKNIFVHYTANPGTSAMQNRSYFENLGVTKETSASAHFVIGYEGEILQCIPLTEIGYAVKERNYDSVSIECCYLSEDGKFTEETYQSLIQLSAWLLKEYKLTPEDMLRHYDAGGKKCPLYYVEHEDAWQQFLLDLEDYIKAV